MRLLLPEKKTVNDYEAFSRPGRLVGQLSTKDALALLRNRSGEAVIFTHVTDVEVLNTDDVASAAIIRC